MSATAVTTQRKEFNVDFAFTKSAETETGDLELVGYANTWVQDRDGDFVAEDAFDESLPAYLDKNPILLYQHNKDWGIGFIDEATTDKTGLKVRAIIPKPEAGEATWKHTAYHNCRRGIYRTFSIGGFFSYDVENVGEDDEKWIVTRIELLEISVVSIPSNPDSIFEAAMKAHGATRSVTLSEKSRSQMMQLLGIEDVTDPELVALDDTRREDRYNELSAVFEKAMGRSAPDFDAYHLVLRSVDEGDLAGYVAVLPELEKIVDGLHRPPESAQVRAAAAGLTKEQSDVLADVNRLLAEASEKMQALLPPADLTSQETIA